MKIKKTVLYFTIALMACLSCNSGGKTIIITDFSKPFSDTLYPNENRSLGYTTFSVEINGVVNDSIMLEFHDNVDAIPLYFNGEIEERLTFDYYGGAPQYISFKPYRATEGKLKIKYGLY